MQATTPNHGTVVAELVEYRDGPVRIVVCELQDGWHVVEVYRANKVSHRHVVEGLSEAREYARASLPA